MANFPRSRTLERDMLGSFTVNDLATAASMATMYPEEKSVAIEDTLHKVSSNEKEALSDDGSSNQLHRTLRGCHGAVRSTT